MVRGDAEATLRSGQRPVGCLRKKTACGSTRTWLACAWIGRGPDAATADGLARFRGHGETIHQSGRSLLGAVVSRSARGTRSRADVAGRGADFDRSSDRIGPRGRHPLHRLPATPHPRRHPAARSIPTTPPPPSKPTSPPSPSRSEQGARSFGLLAALKLAKLYQSTARPVEAHDILAPALEGFSPTPEMPEIAEGQALLAALVETDKVKVAAASRERRLKLQTSYGQAMAWSRGFANEEATKAFLAQTNSRR